MLFGHFKSALLALLLVVFHLPGLSQRLRSDLEDSSPQALAGNVPLAARLAVDQGAIDDGFLLSEMTIRFNRTAAQQEELSALLKEQQTPESGRFHRWLTPEEFAARFGLSSSDVDIVSNWLRAHGFTVTHAARGHTFLTFSGTAGQVWAAFHTRIHRVSLHGEGHYANLTPPELPSFLSAVTMSLTGLHDFHSLVPISSKRQRALPSATFTSGGETTHLVVPADFHTIYDVNSVLAKGIDGSGVSIAVVGQTDIDPQNLTDFRKAAGLPALKLIQKLYGTDPGISSADVREANLDLQWAGANAPGAQLIFANGKDVLFNSLAGAVDDNLAPVISMSYGDCEAENYYGAAIIASTELLLQQAAAQGQTLVAGSGDWGGATCSYYAPGDEGLTLFYPASSPNATSVGGTSFNEGTGSFWSATNGPTYGSALSYIPEVVWNDTYASGGGVSRYLAKPYWQTGNGVPSDFGRDVPDVSFMAGGSDVYVSCDDHLCSGGTFSSGLGGTGTSYATPAFAGIVALLAQQFKGPLGNINPTLYALANSPYYTSVFHDITSGNNVYPCTQGTPDCAYGGGLGYTASLGYDLTTGWGSIDVANLLDAWSKVTPTAPTAKGSAISQTTVSSSAASVVQGTAITLTAQVASAGGSGTPTGTVQFLVNDQASGNAVPVLKGLATYTLDTSPLRGEYRLAAAYSGDMVFGGSRNLVRATIISGVPRAPAKVTLSASPSQISSGEAVTLTASVASASSSGTQLPTGTIQLALENGSASSPLNNPLPLINGQASLRVPAVYTAVLPATFQANYYGDATFLSGQASLTLTPPQPADFSIAPSAPTITVKAGSSGSLTLVVSSLNGFNGTISLATSAKNVFLSSNSVSVTPTSPGSLGITVNAYGAVASLEPAPVRGGIGVSILLCCTPAGLFFLFMRGRNNFRACLMLLLVTAFIGLSGCSGSSTQAPTSTGPTALSPGTYNLSIVATGSVGGSQIQHNLQIVLNVN